MWYEGQFGNLYWYAKIYDLPSKYGIYGGRIGKLEVKNKNGDTIIHYDRSWAMMPTISMMGDFNELLDFLETTPIQEEV